MFVNPIHRRLLARLLTVVPSRLPIVMMLMMMMMVIMMNTPCKSPHAWVHVHRFFISFTIIPSLVYHRSTILSFSFVFFHNFPSFPGNHFSIFCAISIVYNLAIVCHQVGFPNVDNKYFPTISQMWKTNISYFC